MSTGMRDKPDDGDAPFGPVIFSYSRRQAIEDGVLVDLTQWARETGFCIPVACTSALWQQWVVPPEKARALGQSERGRAHDVLWMLLCAIRRAPRGADLLYYQVVCQQSPGRSETIRLKAICGPGDQGEPVLTILLPEED
jgi:hypothetical protein